MKQTKQGFEAYIDSSMQPNLLYGSSDAPQPSHPDISCHDYESVTSVGTAVNIETNVVCGTQNPLFCSSDTILESREQQPADQDPGPAAEGGTVAITGDSKHLSCPPLPPHDGMFPTKMARFMYSIFYLGPIKSY